MPCAMPAMRGLQGRIDKGRGRSWQPASRARRALGASDALLQRLRVVSYTACKISLGYAGRGPDGIGGLVYAGVS